jgi:hypothetical protein
MPNEHLRKLSMLFWVVTPGEDAHSMFIRNVRFLRTSPHGVTTQNNNIDLFTAVRTSNLTFTKTVTLVNGQELEKAEFTLTYYVPVHVVPLLVCYFNKVSHFEMTETGLIRCKSFCTTYCLNIA